MQFCILPLLILILFCRERIVHMDVKPGNIFLDEQFNARLGDAGMAQDLPMEYSHATLTQIRGTPGYLDVFLTDRHSKPENDIFSFGIGMQLLKTVLFYENCKKMSWVCYNGIYDMV